VSQQHHAHGFSNNFPRCSLAWWAMCRKESLPRP
jgi:hypothetical protein